MRRMEKEFKTKNKIELLKSSSLAYRQTINSLVSEMISEEQLVKKTSAHVVAPINSSVKTKQFVMPNQFSKKQRKITENLKSFLFQITYKHVI